MMNTEHEITRLYQSLIQGWNNKNAAQMADLFELEATMIGFDGTLMTGQKEIENHLAQIFASYPTGEYITVTQEVRFLSENTALLRSATGMVPRQMDDINPNVNAHQTMVASKNSNQWKISLFQNTPASFHMDPEAAKQMSALLRTELKKQSKLM